MRPPRPASREINAALGKRSRMRKRALSAAVDLNTVSSSRRRNDILPTLVIEQRAINSLTPASRRLRKVDPEHIAEIARSIALLGFAVPVLITRDGVIINGHSTVEAARQIGLEAAPCIIIDHLTSDEIRLLRIAVNRLGERGTWDLDALKAEFEALIELEIPLDVTGFELPEIDLVLAGDEASLDERANIQPEIEQHCRPVSCLGDIWLLGKNKVHCADATLATSYAALMAGSEASVIFTDPPYNLRIKDIVGRGEIKHREFVEASGEMTPDQFEVFLARFLKAAASSLVTGGLAYACMDWRSIVTLARAGDRAALDLVNIIVWAKSSGGMGGIYRSAHEFIALFKKPGAAHINNVQLGRLGRDRTNVWDYPGASSMGSSARQHLADHPTPKPVELVADALLDVTRRGDIVLDPFLGSGTTIIAAERTRRIAYPPSLCRYRLRRR